MEQYPLPHIEDIFAKLAGGQKFTKIDLRQAYHQMVVEESSKEYLTINTRQGLYHYNHLALYLALLLKGAWDWALKPDIWKMVTERQSQVTIGDDNSMRELHTGQRVVAQSYRGEDKWDPGIVTVQLDPLSCEEKVAPNAVWWRQIDQLEDLLLSPQRAQPCPTAYMYALPSGLQHRWYWTTRPRDQYWEWRQCPCWPQSTCTPTQAQPCPTEESRWEAGLVNFEGEECYAIGGQRLSSMRHTMCFPWLSAMMFA